MIKIEISGTGDEVRNELLKLLGLQATVAQVQPQVHEESAKETETEQAPSRSRRLPTRKEPAGTSQMSWTEKEAEKLLNKVSPDARRIIAEVAKKPEGCKPSELVQVLGLKSRSVGGQLSSVGKEVKRMGNKPTPLLKVKADGGFVYKLDPIVANVAKKLTG